MTIRQHISNSVMLLIVSLALMSFKTADQSAAEALASRVMGGKASALAFEQIDSPTDYYELVQKGSKVRRQAIGNRALAVRKRFADAYKAGDRAAMVAASKEFLRMCDRLTEVLKTRREFSLSDWLRDARAWGRNKAEKDYFERNARTIITVWGDTYHLSDYANRDWDGLVETFYKVRWQMFFDAVLAAFDAGEPFVNLKGPRVPNGRTKEECERALKLDAEIWDFETQWAHW